MDEWQPLPPDRQPPLTSLVGVLQTVVQRIKEQPYLLVIGVSTLVVILVLGAIWIAPEFSGPVYAALIVIGVVALVALIVTAVLEARKRRQETQGEQVKKESDMSKLPPDCESLKRQLEMARRTLAVLEEQAAGIPELERTATFSVNLREQREKVAKLERELAECLEREASR